MKSLLITSTAAILLALAGAAGGESQTIRYEYDAQGRLARMIVSTDQVRVTDYQYDAAGNLVSTSEGTVPETVFASGFE